MLIFKKGNILKNPLIWFSYYTVEILTTFSFTKSLNRWSSEDNDERHILSKIS